jgi:hypothetical protein
MRAGRARAYAHAALAVARARATDRTTLLVALFVVAIALATLYVQYRAMLDDSAGRPLSGFIEHDLAQRHRDVLDRTVGDPWRYRLLSEWGAEGSYRVARAAGFHRPYLVGFLAFRALQNIAIFALAWALYRRFGFDRFACALGLGLVAWGMTQSTLHAALAFNTWGDIVFYLAGGLLILQRRYAWVLPLTVLATLNRETSGLIPVMLLVVAWSVLGLRTPEGARAARIGAAALAAFAVTYGVVRVAVGSSFLILANGRHPGWELFEYNVARGITWDELFQTMNVVPLLALLAIRRWPVELRAFAIAVVPAWFAIHVLSSVLAESRLVLVPYALVFVPGALAGLAALQAREAPRAVATAPQP